MLHHQTVQPRQHSTDGLVGEVLQVFEQVNRELKGTGRRGEGGEVNRIIQGVPTHTIQEVQQYDYGTISF